MSRRAEAAEGDLVVRRAWIPYFNIQYYLGVDGISLSLVVLDRARQRAGLPGVVEHREAGQGLLRALPAADGQHDGRVHLARPVPVLRLLRSDAPADVLPDRHLGRPQARVRGDQVPALHAVRLGVHPGRDPDPLLLAEPTSAVPGFTGHSFDIVQLTTIASETELLPAIDPVVGLHAVLHRLHRQAAVVPVPHLASRRARRGPDADQHDPGGHPAQDRRLRPDPAGLAAGPGRCLRLVDVWSRSRRLQHPLRRPGGDGPDRLQEAGRLQLGQPHGLRHAGHGRHESSPATAARSTRGITPTGSTARCS